MFLKNALAQPINTDSNGSIIEKSTNQKSFITWIFFVLHRACMFVGLKQAGTFSSFFAAATIKAHFKQ